MVTTIATELFLPLKGEETIFQFFSVNLEALVHVPYQDQTPRALASCHYPTSEKASTEWPMEGQDLYI